MVKLDHLALFVADEARSRDWYVRHFGFRVEFEVPERHTVALQDDADLTLFLVRAEAASSARSCVLTLQVDDVDATCAALVRAGVELSAAPQKLYWGYGAELLDPDGHEIHLWDETSMRTRGS